MSFSQGNPTVSHVISTANCLVFGNTSSGNALSVQQLGAGNVFSFSNSSGRSNVFVMNNLGQVGIGQTSPASGMILDVRNTTGLVGDEKLGSTSGNQSNVIVQIGNGSSSTFGALKIIGNRTATGSDWVTTSLRIQKYVDVTQMGYMEFGAVGGNQDIAFGTGGTTERMRITSGGYVGIGTASPSAPLHVGDGTVFQNGTAQITTAGFLNSTVSQNGYTGICLGKGSSTYDSWFITHCNVASGSSTNYLSISPYSAATQFAFTAAGRFGIGLTNPFTPLHLTMAQSTPNSSGNMSNGFAISNGTGGPAMNMGVVNSGSTYYGWIQSAFINNAGVTNPLILNPLGGNVGVGTASPGWPLHVNGAFASSGRLFTSVNAYSGYVYTFSVVGTYLITYYYGNYQDINICGTWIINVANIAYRSFVGGNPAGYLTVTNNGNMTITFGQTGLPAGYNNTNFNCAYQLLL